MNKTIDINKYVNWANTILKNVKILNAIEIFLLSFLVIDIPEKKLLEAIPKKIKLSYNINPILSSPLDLASELSANMNTACIFLLLSK